MSRSGYSDDYDNDFSLICWHAKDGKKLYLLY